MGRERRKRAGLLAAGMREWMECLGCWVLFSVGRKGEHVPGASFS